MTQHEFVAVLKRPKGTGTWTYFDVPLDTKKAFGRVSRIPVRGTIDMTEFRSSLLPNGTGGHFMVVKSDLRSVIGKEAGEKIHAVMRLDTTPREIKVPPVILRRLRENQEARKYFEGLSYSHKKEYVEWIQGAKRTDTREIRLKKMIELLATSRTLR